MGLRWTIYCDAEYLKRTFKRCFLLCFMYIKNKQLYILYHNLKREFHLKTTIKDRLCLYGPHFPILSQKFSCSVFVIPWIAACQASLSITNSQSLHKLMSIELVMPSNHVILCRPFSHLQFPASGSFQPVYRK